MFSVRLKKFIKSLLIHKTVGLLGGILTIFVFTKLLILVKTAQISKKIGYDLVRIACLLATVFFRTNFKSQKVIIFGKNWVIYGRNLLSFWQKLDILWPRIA